MSAAVVLAYEFTVVTCCECGVAIALPNNRYRVLREECGWFWCCNGHRQAFIESKNAKLQKQLDNTQKRLEWAEQATQREREAKERAKRSAASYKGKLTHVKAHVGAGLCPCCRRHFKQLSAHMANKHPDYGASE